MIPCMSCFIFKPILGMENEKGDDSVMDRKDSRELEMDDSDRYMLMISFTAA